MSNHDHFVGREYKIWGVSKLNIRHVPVIYIKLFGNDESSGARNRELKRSFIYKLIGYG